LPTFSPLGPIVRLRRGTARGFVLVDREGLDAILVETGGEFAEGMLAYCVLPLLSSMKSMTASAMNSTQPKRPRPKRSPELPFGCRPPLPPPPAAILAVARAVRSLFGHR
jgi:hypothetical protein